MQEDASEFLEEAKLKELVAKYSEFINFPIYLWGCAPTSTSLFLKPRTPVMLFL